MAKAKDKSYVVADKGYLFKGGQVIKTGETVTLSAEEYENVKDLVLEDNSDEGKALAEQEAAQAKAKAEAEAQAQAEAEAKAKAQADAEANKDKQDTK